MPLPRTSATFVSPIVESRRWVSGVVFPDHLPLLNVSQAAPIDPPPMPLRDAIADAARTDASAHLYGPVLGRPELREALAAQISDHYAGRVTPQQSGITSGCNQAFAAAVASLCSENDEVIIPTPWYFNHKMWLDLSGVQAVPLPVGDGMLPGLEDARARITAKTRAILLVTPNNPTGAEYPAGLLQAFHDLARAHGIALIVDETYRDFDSRTGPPHNLFQLPNWDDTLIHLYSFSKAYRLTGHRVGAIVASEGRLAEMEKFLDTVTICPNQLGQIAAQWGIANLQDWLAGEREEILARRAAIRAGFPVLAAQSWRLLGCGAYFAYVAHPFAASSDEIARRLVAEASVLALPGTMFQPADEPAGHRQFRIAFANIDAAEITELFRRLAMFQA